MLYAQGVEDVRITSETFYFSKPDSIFISLRNNYNNAVKKEDIPAQGDALKKMGAICFHLGHYAQALEYYLDAAKLFEQSHSKKDLAEDYNSLGILYYYNQDTTQARLYYNKALQLFQSLRDNSGLAVTYGKIGHLFEKKQQYDSAFHYQRQALMEYSLAANNKGMAKIYENLGSIYEDLQRYDSAMYYFNQALQLYHIAGEHIDNIEVINNIWDIYRKTGDYRKALQYTFMAIASAKKINEWYQLNSGYRDVAKTYNLLGKNDSAFYYLEISRRYLLEIYSRENSKQMAFLQAQYDEEKKNNEIEQLQNSKRINVVITTSVIIIIVLLIILGLAIFNRQKLKIRSQEAMNLQNRDMLQTRNKLMETELKASQLEEEKLKTELENQQLEKDKVDAELKATRLEEEQLKQQIEQKSKELSTQVLHVIQKNQLLEELRKHLEEMVKDDKRDQKRQLKQLILLINQNFNNDNYWEDFKNTFEQVHRSFFENLKNICPDLTATELRLISLLKMNMNSSDMATMLSISQDSLRVARYRLRKKLKLDQGENLVTFLQRL